MNISALTDARLAIFTRMTEATGATEGDSAFMGRLPDITNAWAFHISGGDSDETRDNCWGRIRFDATVVGRFAELAAAEECTMLILELLASTDGLFEEGPVHFLRLQSMPEFSEQVLQIAGETVDSMHWSVTIPMDMMINTS